MSMSTLHLLIRFPFSASPSSIRCLTRSLGAGNLQCDWFKRYRVEIRNKKQAVSRKWISDGNSRICSVSPYSSSSSDDDSSFEPKFRPLNRDSVELSDDSHIYYLKRSVLPSEELHFSSSVVIHGDVSKNSAVHADGDIIVLGSLEGEVHAGKNGNRRPPIVFALCLKPSRISIRGRETSVPGYRPYPEMVSVSNNGSVVIQPAINPNPKDPSKRTAKIALFTGAYISLAGIALILFPNQVFGLLFDVNSMSSGWIRVFGVLALVFGVYYIGSGYADMYYEGRIEGFYIATVYGRLILFSIFCWIVAIGEVQASLLLLGIVNLIGALFLLNALRKKLAASSNMNEA